MKMQQKDCLPLVTLLLCYVVLPSGLCDGPLHLTPLLDAGNFTAAQELSEVIDPYSIIPKSYAGFITGNRALGNHLFFWFFPATSKPQAPLVVWLNGDPGTSSMLGLLWDNGPITIGGNADHYLGYHASENSWSEVFSMLYIDSPVGVGFSYSDRGEMGRYTKAGYAEDLYLFIEQFYIMFPEYFDRELFIGGLGGGGKYAIAFAHRLHKEMYAGNSLIPLTGVYLVAPNFDPPTQNRYFSDYYYNMGAISHAQYLKARTTEEKWADTFKISFQNMTYMTTLAKLYPFYGIVDPYNYATMWYYDLDRIDTFMNWYRIRNITHVGMDFKFTVFNATLQHKFFPDLVMSVKPELSELLNHYPVLVCTGDLDAMMSTVMVDQSLMNTPWHLQYDFVYSDRLIWQDEGSALVKGFYVQIGGLCRVIIHNAGHLISYDQPNLSREMMERFINEGCIRPKFRQSL